MTKNTSFNQTNIVDQLNSKLLEIKKIINKEYNSNNLGVLTGLSGIALFNFHFSRFANDEESSEIGVKIIRECFDRINNGYEFPTYCSGITGLGWTLEHLAEENFIEFNNDELLSNLDSYLFEKLAIDSSLGQFDFLHGSIGYGYYFLKRYNNTLSNKLKKKYKFYLLELINKIDLFAIEIDNQIKWESIIDLETKKKGYNFSLSHGIPSIINFLSRLHSIDDFKLKLEPLIKKSISYILHSKSDDPDHYSLFPNIECEPYNKNRHSRLAWCYGDLGVGITLFQASKILDDNNLNETAINILKHSSKRILAENTLIKDAGVCHGAFGIAKTFTRLFKETNDITFKEASYYWINEGLKMGYHEDGYAGYKKWVGGKGIWEKELSLLEGITGIGLVIIDYLNDNEGNWDECLMLS